MQRLVASFLLLSLALACRTAPIYNVADAPVPPGLSADQVREAISMAATHRGWSIGETAPGQLVANIQLRGHSASVEIRYSDRSYSIHYRDSENLDYGGDKIHKNYNGWIINLHRSIDDELIRIGSTSHSSAPSRLSPERACPGYVAHLCSVAA